MFVEWRMTAQPFTISPEATVPEAVELMHEHNVRKLPVMDGGRLVGVVSQSDIDRASPSMATSFSAGEVAYLLNKLKVRKVMTKNPTTITKGALLEEAAIMMRDQRIEMLPVMDGDRLVGVITESDILEAFIDLMGSRTPGSRLVIEADDQPGVLARLTGLFAEQEVNITNLAVYRLGTDRAWVVVGVNSLNTEALEKRFDAASGFTVKYTLRNRD